MIKLILIIPNPKHYTADSRVKKNEKSPSDIINHKANTTTVNTPLIFI